MGLSGFGLGMGGLTIFRRGLEWVWGGLGCVWVRRAWGWEWVWPGLGWRGFDHVYKGWVWVGLWVWGGFRRGLGGLGGFVLGVVGLGWVWAGFGLGLGGFDHV